MVFHQRSERDGDGEVVGIGAVRTWDVLDDMSNCIGRFR